MSFAVIIIILALIAFNYTEHTSVIQSVMLVFLGAVMFMQGLEERKKENDGSGAFNIYTAVLYGLSPLSVLHFILYKSILHILKMLDRRERGIEPMKQGFPLLIL
nr:unknown protein [Bacillus subtilis]BAA09042.1 ycsL [Bacillus subtilis]prf//2208409Q ORF [Bacillus subtilis]